MHLPIFLRQRSRLLALAYRMLGSRADAQDAVQDAWLRWSGCVLEDLDTPEAYLTRLTTHLCLDRLKSARSRREQYVGVCLPEPLAADDACVGPEGLVERAQRVSYGWLLALQRLGPLERAAFLLREVFELEYPEIGRVLQRRPEACRQLASRAKRKLAEEPAAATRPPADPEGLFRAFVGALESGDAAELSQLLAEDALYMADGGGKARALPAPLSGRLAVARLLLGIWRRWRAEGFRLTPQWLNGMPGALAWRDGRLEMALSLECDAAGRIIALYAMRNPDKLAHLSGSA
ncbi:RNA polymerase sigma factor SigJ [Chromobacterium sp. IIBBL 290-4]|uniref:RNA polymerase sigma factor SigJ n=1 Tax=Chromobacterium sp. IIBBL 290-4 TaxID=2953890 RepID=UPI0020B7D4AB|nr:RNA polymerase sigma factor SigJ [Chromobacterium sp. IIBBL 290-4]UTH75374.1 RNA polymerase sigma factor SigJ [Chromobacterium sp. IIBBL 290-4]